MINFCERAILFCDNKFRREVVLMNNQERIYGHKVNVGEKKIRTFFDKRAIDFSLNKKSRNTTVLLGDGNSVYCCTFGLSITNIRC